MRDTQAPSPTLTTASTPQASDVAPFTRPTRPKGDDSISPGAVVHSLVVRTLILDELGELSAQWDRLVLRQPVPTPFLLSWWVDAMAAGRPTIIAVLDNDELVGGAAFEVDKIGPPRARVDRVRFLGQGVLEPDHLDVLADESHRGQVVASVVRWLRSGSHMIDLEGIAAGSDLVPAIGIPVLEEQIVPYLELDGGDPLAGLPGQVRNTAKRALKRLEREGIRPRRVDPQEGTRALETLLHLHESRWSEDSKFVSAWERFRRGAAVGIQRGDVVIHELVRSDDEVIASELELVSGPRISFYQAGRLVDHEYRGSGSALKAVVLQWAAESGAREFDLLRGDEPYKQGWSSARRSQHRARGGAGIAGRLAAGVANTTYRSAPRFLSAVERVTNEQTSDKVRRAIVERVH